MVIRSGDCKHIYPDNRVYDFRVNIPKTIHLSGNWNVTLLEFAYQLNKTSPEKDIYVCCDLCSNTIVGDTEIPLLRRLYLNRKAENLIFSSPYGVPLKTGTIQEIHIYLTTSKNELASFLTGQLTITLQFINKPFLKKMVGSTYISDPDTWKTFYHNMINGKFKRGKSNQVAGGIGGMYSNKPYMIPISQYKSETIQKPLPMIGNEVSPIAAIEERAKSEFKDAIKDEAPRVPIKSRKRKRNISPRKTVKQATSKKRKKQYRKSNKKVKTKKKAKTGKRKIIPLRGENIFKNRKV